jgi:hypothetical protein
MRISSVTDGENSIDPDTFNESAALNNAQTSRYNQSMASEESEWKLLQ